MNTEKLTKAIINLQNDFDFAIIKEHLEETLRSHIEQFGFERDEVKLRWVQGKVVLLKELLMLFETENIEKALERIEQNKQEKTF